MRLVKKYYSAEEKFFPLKQKNLDFAENTENAGKKINISKCISNYLTRPGSYIAVTRQALLSTIIAVAVFIY